MGRIASRWPIDVWGRMMLNDEGKDRGGWNQVLDLKGEVSTCAASGVGTF